MPADQDEGMLKTSTILFYAGQRYIQPPVGYLNQIRDRGRTCCQKAAQGGEFSAKSDSVRFLLLDNNQTAGDLHQTFNLTHDAHTGRCTFF